MAHYSKKMKTQLPPSSSADSSPSDDAAVLERIVPVIKAIEFEETGLRHIALSDDDAPVAKSFAGDLMVMYAEDLPEHFSFLSQKRVRELGLDMEALHALAVDNLARRLPPIELHGNAPRYMITAGGNLEATLLLHPSLWESLAEHLPGDPVAVVPARDLLLVTSSEWEEGRALLREMAEKHPEDQRYALSKLLFIRRNGSWVVDGAYS